MKAVIIHAGKQSIDELFEVKEIEDDLDTYYKEIGCDDIEIPKRYIGGRLFNIVCDGEALLKEHPIPSMLTMIV